MDQNKVSVGKWWLLITILIVLSTIIFTMLNYAGVFGERFIFENSFQYQESRKAEIAIYEAQLTELQNHLRNPDLTLEEIDRIESQMTAIQIRLNTAKAKRK